MSKATLGPSPTAKRLSPEYQGSRTGNYILRRPSVEANPRTITTLTSIPPKPKQQTGLPGLRVTPSSKSSVVSKISSKRNVTISSPTKKPQRPHKSMLVTDTLNSVTEIREPSQPSPIVDDNEGLSRSMGPGVSQNFEALGMKQQPDTTKRSPVIMTPEVRRAKSNLLIKDGPGPKPMNIQNKRIIKSMLVTGTLNPVTEIQEPSQASPLMNDSEGVFKCLSPTMTPNNVSRCMSPGVSLNFEALGMKQQADTIKRSPMIATPEVKSDLSNLLTPDRLRLTPREIQKTRIIRPLAQLSKYL
jgi:hypothetical protein